VVFVRSTNGKITCGFIDCPRKDALLRDSVGNERREQGGRVTQIQGLTVKPSKMVPEALEGPA